MKTLLVILFGICAPKHPFEEDMNAANKFLLTQIKAIQSINKSSSANPQEALSIVFPEIMRWRALQDLMETQALEIAYINLGRKGADFSIGHFQMKPSFIEKLEEYIDKHSELKFLNYIVIKEEKKINERKKRLYRLKNFKWQLRYAHVYWHLAENRFRHIRFKTVEEKIHFYATAYNFGFGEKDKQILEWQNKKLFPYGKTYKGPQVKYADLSIEFFREKSIIYR